MLRIYPPMWPFKKAPLNRCIVGTRMNTGQFCQQFTNHQYLASASRGNLPSRHSVPGEPELHTRVASALGKAKTPRYLLNGNRISEALQHLGVNSHFMFMRLPPDLVLDSCMSDLYNLGHADLFPIWR